MANQVDVEILESGPRNAMLLVYIKSDGNSGDLESYTLATRAQLGVSSVDRLKLEAVEYNLAGFDAVLEFGKGENQLTPLRRWVLAEGSNTPADFSPYGGLGDVSGMLSSGDLQISTTGLDSSLDQGSILIKLRKYL